jgi:hypothetical protein
VLTGPSRSATKPTTARPMHTEKPNRVVGLRAGQLRIPPKRFKYHSHSDEDGRGGRNGESDPLGDVDEGNTARVSTVRVHPRHQIHDHTHP